MSHVVLTRVGEWLKFALDCFVFTYEFFYLSFMFVTCDK